MLSGLLSLLDSAPEYRRLLERLRAGHRERVLLLESVKAFLLASLWRQLGATMLVVTASSEGAKRLQEQLLTWLGDEKVVCLFPEGEALPYERLSPDLLTLHQRLATLSLLSPLGGQRLDSPLLVTSARALSQKTLSPQDFASSSHVLRLGERVDVEGLLARWAAMGYERVAWVEMPGTMSKRGGILDIYPPGSDLPARIELFGDILESLRLFEPSSQRSLRLVESVAVVPAQELLLGDGRRATEALAFLDLASCSPEARERIERELTFFREGRPFSDSGFYSPLFNKDCLLDYLPQGSMVALDESEEVERTLEELDEQAEELRSQQMQRGELPANFPRPYHLWRELDQRLKRFPTLSLSSLAGWDGVQKLSAFLPTPFFGGRLRNLLEEVEARLRSGERVVIFSQQSRRLCELLEERGVPAGPQEVLKELPPQRSLSLVHGSLDGGWTWEGRFPTTLLTDAEIFGFVKQRRAVRRQAPSRAHFLFEPSPGDYLVHIEHGIGRFAGVTTMSLEGVEREYLVLEYAEGDKLYVPSDQLDRLSRYLGPGDQTPSLTRLGTQDWARAKERVKRAVGQVARELLDLYSARRVVTGFAFSSDTVWQQELEASFPYIETPDQLQAVQEVKTDMEQIKPMDRLVCGDVGYGKTEVAIRAAFKAVMDGTQVAVLVPTTVLAQQHLSTFQERLGAFPVKVEMLSRFRSEREQREILEGLREGSIDICIGTHRLLQKDVSFKNLGLVIIDEEQRFGVLHKERLKQMRREVDVLTLSATPIPRTLHMSLVGVRDMSTMETPPEERLPIKTYLSRFDEGLIREVILRELDRGGQVFFVHNRVQGIAYMAQRLRTLLPEAQIAVAHGQMPEEELERVMLEFTQGKVDVLVCTTIIESGLDIPNVNTLIVNQADRFGLAQLYQLRGRVGRGANRAYAYFLYDQDKRPTEAAQKRLRTIFEATELGAGFRIAMKDLEIRGAGDLLGTEQSGHIAAVGFELYCRLLAEAVQELKAKEGLEEKAAPKPPQVPSIDLPLSAYLPEGYVPELSTRLALYQRFTQLWSPQEVEDMAQELEDRFGRPPPPAKNLLYLLKLRALGAQAGLQSLSQEDGQVVLRLGRELSLDRVPLERAYGPGLRFGRTQVRLDLSSLRGRWQEALEAVVKAMA